MAEKQLWYNKIGFYTNPFSIKPAAFHNEVVGYDIEEIFSKVESGSVLFVSGNMGVGKTTILKILLQKFGGKKKVIYCSCNVSDRKISFRKLLVGNSFFGKLLSSPSSNIILLVDEAQEIKKQESAEILKFFKKGNFRSVVFFGTQYPKETMATGLDNLLNDNIKVLQKLKPDHAVEIVRKRIGDLAFISDASIKRVYKLSGYNPRKLLENIEDVFKHASDRSAVKITDAHIKAVVKEPIVEVKKEQTPKIVIEQIEHSDVPLNIEPIKHSKPAKVKKVKYDAYGIRTYEEEMKLVKQEVGDKNN